MGVKIQLRNDTASNWSLVNPILAQGEVGVENDTLKLKVGNGVSTWNGLNYYTFGDGTGYVPILKTENNVRVVQGVPIGGQLRISTSFTGAIKIVFPTHLIGNGYSFDVSIRSNNRINRRFTISGIDSTTEYSSAFMRNSLLVEQREQLHVGSTIIMPVTFNNSSSTTYITIGNVTDFYSNGVTVVISNVRTTGTINPNWSNGWTISIITEFETLDSTTQLTVTPSFNATHLNGTMTSNVNGGVTQKKSSIQSLEVENDAGTTIFNVNTTNRFIDNKGFISKYRGANVASATTITPTGEIFHVTGTTAIATITPPTGLTDCMQITIIPGGIFTTTTAGNIALATTAVVNRALTMTYDVTTSKWYPSY